jgi:putative transposase
MATSEHGEQDLVSVAKTSAVRLNLRPGVKVQHHERAAVIKRIPDLNSVLLTYEGTNEVAIAKIAELQAAAVLRPLEKVPEPGDISEHDLERAKIRLEIIKPLSCGLNRTRAHVNSRAREFNVHPSTIYNWLSRYDANSTLTSLIRKQRDDIGHAKLAAEREAIVQQTITDEWLTPQRKSIRDVYKSAKDKLINAGLSVVHYNTIRARLSNIDDRKKIASRHGREAAEEKYDPSRSSFPGADWPLAITQIDHTKLDVIVVDSITRRATITPWLTVLIDVFSRMILGFYLSLDPPGTMGTGLCIANAVMPKEICLSKLDLNFEWPCWGFPAAIHADNAGEFRGGMLKEACQQYGMDLIWRPVRKPRYGAHIERLLGTLKTAIHAVPGTTFADPKDRGDYDSEAKAILTIDELEKWLVTRIIEYHNQVHSTLGISPLRRFEEGVLRGSAEYPATGLPPRITDIAAQERLRLDLMPFFKRTIQRDGVAIEKFHYYSDVLQPWINASDPRKPGTKRRFKFRRDPRDISRIWFYDPEIKEYFAIPLRNTSIQPMSIWEVRESRKFLKNRDFTFSDIDEQAISHARDKMREIEDNARRSTKAARTKGERRRHWAQTAVVHSNNEASVAPTSVKDYVRVTRFMDTDEENKKNHAS